MVQYDTADQVTSRTNIPGEWDERGSSSLKPSVLETKDVAVDPPGLGGAARQACGPNTGSEFLGVSALRGSEQRGFSIGEEVLVVDEAGLLSGEDIYPGIVVGPTQRSLLSAGPSHWVGGGMGREYTIQFRGGHRRLVCAALLRPPPDGVVAIEASGAGGGADQGVSDEDVVEKLLAQRDDCRGDTVPGNDGGVVVKPHSGLFVSDFSNPDADHGTFVACYPFARGGPGRYPFEPIDPDSVDPYLPNPSSYASAPLDPKVVEANRKRTEYARALRAFKLTRGRMDRPVVLGFNRHTEWGLHLAGFHFSRHPRFLIHMTLRFVS